MFGRLFALFSFVYLPFIQLLFVKAGTSISSSLKLLLKFQNALKHTESQSSFACNQNFKEDIPRALEVFPCFETNGTTETDSPRKYPRNARIIYPRKNWLQRRKKKKKNSRRITLRRPIWRIRYLTFIISWSQSIKKVTNIIARN